MANELKAMLPKVLGSGGEKKFFFAYGVGKRKDKKGDGELAVAGKKPKKPEIEAALDACKEFMEGVCWCGKGEDKGTVYFQCKGKKLSAMVVAKMALSAKATTGKQHDFQIPSPEEEARVAAIKETEGDEGEGEEETGEPVATTEPEPKPDSKPEAKPEKQPTPGDPGAEYKKRLAEWTPAIKQAMADKVPNAAAIAKALAQATASAKPGGDMAQALVALTEAHTLATQPVSKPTEKPVVTDPAAEYKKKLAEWTPTIKQAMADKVPNAAAIAKALAQATAQSKPGGDAAQALVFLTEAHTLATGGKKSETEPEGRKPEPVVEQPGARKPLLPIWVAAKEAADAGIGKLQAALKAADDEDLKSIAEYGLYGATTGQATKLMAALRDADSAKTPEAYKKLIDAADSFRDYLDGAPIVDLIEDNVFGVEVPLRKTLGSALDEVGKLAASWSAA